MAKTKTKKPAKETAEQYFLKLVVYLILGSFWVRIVTDGGGQLPLPLGLMIGLFMLRHERFQIDKKIEYALLLLSAFISFWLPLGLHIAI